MLMSIRLFLFTTLFCKDLIILKNLNQASNISLFNKKIKAHTGLCFCSRSIFFFHNKTTLSNLFLTKKIKPRPISNSKVAHRKK